MENVMSELIYKADKELLAEKGLEFPFKMFKKVDLGKYGKCDLVHFTRHSGYVVHIDLISCNRDKISMSSFIDLVTCAKGIEKYLRNNHNLVLTFHYHIIAKEIDSKSNICFLPDVTENINFYLYKANINGIYFESLHGCELINEELIKLKKKKTVPKLKSLQALRDNFKIQS